MGCRLSKIPVLFFLTVLLPGVGRAWQERMHETETPRPISASVQEKVPAEAKAASLKADLEKPRDVVAAMEVLGRQTREPVLLSSLEPALQQKTSQWARTELSDFSLAVFNRSDIDEALAKLESSSVYDMAKSLSKMAKNPVANSDAIYLLEFRMNMTLHAEGINVRFVVEPPRPRLTQGRLVVMINEVVAVHKAEIAGNPIPVYELKQIDKTKFPEALVGTYNPGATYALINSKDIDQVVADFPAAKVPQGLKGGELRQMFVNAIVHHEASHVFFYQKGGVELATKKYGAPKVREMNEMRAFLSEFIAADPVIADHVLKDIADTAVAVLPADRKIGTRSMMIHLQDHIEQVKFAKPVGIDFPTLEIDKKALPQLYRLPLADRKAAATAALDEFDRKLGLR